MRAQKCIVLPGERASAFEASEAALLTDLAPQGALQTVLAQRVVAASWRLARAERLEAELFARNMLDGRGLGLALIRDCNGARAFDTLLRYRGGTLAELWRALRTLKALQAERAALAPEPAAPPEPRLLPEPPEKPIEPDARTNADIAAGVAERAPLAEAEPVRLPHRAPLTAGDAARVRAIEPERRARPTDAAPPSLPSEMVEQGGSVAALLAGTALVPLGRRRWP